MGKMRRLLLIGGLVFGLCGMMKAQTPAWNWANNLTAPSASLLGIEVATDAAGNIYVVAESHGPGSNDGMHFGKYNQAGVEIWSVTIMNCNPFDLYTDSAGFSYVTGSFYNSATIGASTFICRGILDMFVAKFDPSGNVIWARRAGASYHPSNWPFFVPMEDEGAFVGADAAGNCYVAGTVICRDTSAAIFDTIQIHAPAGSAEQAYYYLAKYNPNGEIQWVRTITTDHWRISGMTVTPTGDCFIAVEFSNATFSHSGFTLSSTPNGHLLYAKYDTDGNLKWAKNTGGQGQRKWGKIAVNNQGECYFTGTFKGTAQIGSFTITCPTNQDMLFFAKCDTAGTISWVNKTTGTGQSSIDRPSIQIDPDGNSYISIHANGGIQVGSQDISPNANFTSYSILTKWSSNGSPLWAVRPTGTIHSYGENIYGLSLDPTFTKCYVTGHSSSSYTFGSHTVGAGGFLAELGNIVTSSPVEVSSSALLVYPNPNSTRMLYFEPGQFTAGANFQLLNTLGQIVHQFTFTNPDQNVLRLPKLSAGAYVLQVQSEAKVYRQKVILE